MGKGACLAAVMACRIISATRLLAPITLVGRTALSVDMSNEVLHLVLQGCTHHVQCAKDVIADAFAHIGLYHGHMFVSGCVVDGCRAINAANLCDAVGVGYARQQRYKGALG